MYNSLSMDLDYLTELYDSAVEDCYSIADDITSLCRESKRTLSDSEKKLLDDTLLMLAYTFHVLIEEWIDVGLINKTISISEYRNIYDEICNKTIDDRLYCNTHPDEQDDTTHEIDRILDKALDLIYDFDRDKDVFRSKMMTYAEYKAFITDQEKAIISKYAQYLESLYYHL